MKVRQTSLYGKRFILALTQGKDRINKRDEWINKVITDISGRVS